MKYSRLFLLCLCLAILFCVACPAPENPPTPPVTITPIEGAGASLTPISPALVANPITGEETAVTAQELATLIAENTLAAGTLYRVSGSVSVDLSGISEIDGKGAVIVAPAGITLSHFAGSLTDITLDGALTLSDCDGATLTRVQTTAATALSLDTDCEDVALIECRFVGTDLGIANRSDTLTVLSSYASGAHAVTDRGAGNTLVENACLDGAVTLGASDSSLRYCTVTGNLATEGATENLLVAMCDIRQNTVTFEGVHNSVLLLNETASVTVKDSSTVFVCENNVHDTLTLDNTRYLLVNENALAKNPETVAIRDYNGNNLHDVDARVENGVNEEILPHVNLDAHVNMTRKTVVRTADCSNPTVEEYIQTNLTDNSIVILAPGAYFGQHTGVRVEDVKDASIYAYGVLYEQEPFRTGTWSQRAALWMTNCERVSTYGLMVGTVENAAPQVIVLEKLSGNRILCAPAAGMVHKWGTEIEAGFRWDQSYCYGDIAAAERSYSAESGLWIFTYDSQFSYDLINVGDMITCRASKGGNVFNLNYNTDLYFEDVSIVGGAVRCFYDNQAKSGTTLHRVIDVPSPAKVIDEETYQLYLDYEETYGVETFVYIDEFGNYRGTPARSATADFTHPHGGQSGMKATSCIINGLTDDATNQQGKFNRLYDFDFETGALTYGYLRGALSNAGPRHYFEGDTLALYTSAGKLLCETPVLRDSVDNGNDTYTLYIDPAALSPEDIEGFDLSNTCVSALQILVDNRSRNCNGMVYDNILVTNIRSRGFLIKNSDVVVKNCSFINIGMGAIAINMELEWSESGVTENVTIKDNYFENTGYYTNLVYYSPITVYSFAAQSDPSYLVYRDMLIEGNVIRDRATTHAIFLCGVQNAIVRNNDFGNHYDYIDAPAAYVILSQDIEFSGNICATITNDHAPLRIAGTDYRNLFGTDLDAPDAGDKYGTATYVSTFMENPPTELENSLSFSGGWSVGYMSVDKVNSFSVYTGMEGAGHWLAVPGTLWAGIGGMGTTAREYRFLATATNNVAIRYTVERDATVALALTRYFPPYPKARGDGSDNGLFAIFVNGEMVWPTAGGSYTSDTDWYYITQDVGQQELNSSLAALSLSLKAGDEISFIAKRPQDAGRSMFGAAPAVYYLD